MKIIVVKSGVKQLPLFARYAEKKGKKYPYFEAYLDGGETEQELKQLLQTEMKLLSLHMPASITVGREDNKEKKTVDFCREDAVGKASYAKLAELVKFANENEVKYIIIHLGFFNAFLEDRHQVLDKVAEKFSCLETGKVKLCLENIPCWTNICFGNEPIISCEEHWLYFQERCPNVGAVFDVEHLVIDTIFQHFYPQFKKKYKVSLQEKFKKEMGEEMAKAVRTNEPFFKQLVESRISAFLTAVRPDIIHAAGSDYCNYRLIGHLPLVGEALPLQYEGEIKGFKVKDKINHQKWVSPLSDLPGNVYIVLELMLREDYDYLEFIEKNYQYLTRLLS